MDRPVYQLNREKLKGFKQLMFLETMDDKVTEYFSLISLDIAKLQAIYYFVRSVEVIFGTKMFHLDDLKSKLYSSWYADNLDKNIDITKEELESSTDGMIELVIQEGYFEEIT